MMVYNLLIFNINTMEVHGLFYSVVIKYSYSKILDPYLILYIKINWMS